MSRFLAVVVILVLAASATARGEDGQRYGFAGLGGGRGDLSEQFIIDFERNVYWRGHSGVGIKVCKSSENFYCFAGSAMSFAVPKDNLAVGNSWEHGGQSFRVSRQDTVELLGHVLPVFVIESRNGAGADVRFYYSSSQGLIAVSSRKSESEGMHFFLSERLPGPFASEGD